MIVAILIFTIVWQSSNSQNSCIIDPPLNDPNKHSATISALRYSATQSSLYTTSADGTTKIWNYDSSTRKAILNSTISAAGELVNASSQYTYYSGFVISHDGSKIVVGGASTNLQIFDLLQNKYGMSKILQINHTISCLQYAQQNHYILVAGQSNNTLPLQIVSYDQNNNWNISNATGFMFGDISSIALSNDESILFASNGLNSIVIFAVNAQTVYEVKQFINVSGLTKCWKLVLSADSSRLVVVGNILSIYDKNTTGYTLTQQIAVQAQDAILLGVNRLIVTQLTNITIYQGYPQFIYNQTIATTLSLYSLTQGTNAVSFAGTTSGDIQVITCCPSALSNFSNNCYCLPKYVFDPSGTFCTCADPNADIQRGCLCVSGYTLSGNFCQPCSSVYNTSFCIACNSTSCTACSTSYFLNNSQCQSCTVVHCSVCNNNICTSCITGYMLNNSICSVSLGCQVDLGNQTCSSCSIGFYLNSSSLCQKCSTGCLQCDISQNCSTCDYTNNYILSIMNSLSLCICRNGFYAIKNGSCVSCTTNLPGCLICVNESYCSSCDTSNNFVNNFNQCSCAVGSFLSGSSCMNASLNLINMDVNPIQLVFYFTANVNLPVAVLNNIQITCYFYDNSTTITSIQSVQILAINKFANNILSVIVANPNAQTINSSWMVVQFGNTTVQVIDMYQQTLNLSNSDSLISLILTNVVMFILLVFYIRGYKFNYTLNFIQKACFMRYAIQAIPINTFQFLSSLKYSYYSYYTDLIKQVLAGHVEYTTGNFYIKDIDATITRNAAIPICISLVLIVLRLIILFASACDQETNFKKLFIRALEFIEKSIMFPILFFAVANLNFSNEFGNSSIGNNWLYQLNISLSVVYIAYYIGLNMLFLVQSKARRYSKFSNFSELLFDFIHATIIIETIGTAQLSLIFIVAIIRTFFEILLILRADKAHYVDAFLMAALAFEISFTYVLVNNHDYGEVQILFFATAFFGVLHAITFNPNRVTVQPDPKMIIPEKEQENKLNNLAQTQENLVGEANNLKVDLNTNQNHVDRKSSGHQQAASIRIQDEVVVNHNSPEQSERN